MGCSVSCKVSSVRSRMKISVLMNISVLGFYEYIRDISVDSFT